MSRQDEITNRDLQAARRAVARTEMQIRTDGEEVVAQTVWDEAIEQALRSPDIQALRAALSEPTIAKRHGRDRRRESAHQEVMQFVQECQQSG